MVLRIEAGDSATPAREMVRDPTGSPVSRYVSTTRRKMSRARASSSVRDGPLTIEMPTSGLVIVADKDKPPPTRRKRRASRETMYVGETFRPGGGRAARGQARDRREPLCRR